MANEKFYIVAADALPEGTVYVTLTRHPEHDGWRSITVEGGAAQ